MTNNNEIKSSETAEKVVSISPRAFAEKHHFDPKSVRRVMRSMTTEHPGSGARWEITPDAEKALLERMSRSHNKRVVTFAPVAPAE